MADQTDAPSLEDMQHWTWVMGRAQQMMLEAGLGAGVPVIPGFNDPATLARVGDFWSDSLKLWQRFLDPAGEAAAAGSPLYKLKAYNTVNFNLAFFLPHNMEIDAYLKNVLDVRGEVSANAFEDQYFNPYFGGFGLPYAPVPVILSQPRTVGLVLKVGTE